MLLIIKKPQETLLPQKNPHGFWTRRIFELKHQIPNKVNISVDGAPALVPVQIFPLTQKSSDRQTER